MFDYYYYYYYSIVNIKVVNSHLLLNGHIAPVSSLRQRSLTNTYSQQTDHVVPLTINILRVAFLHSHEDR